MATRWRETKKLELRGRILADALELFRRQGYRETTVEHITAKAGVAKGTFFNHFREKPYILAEWYRGITLSALERAESATGLPARDAVALLFQGLAEGASRDPELFARKTLEGTTVLDDAERSLDRRVRGFLRKRIEGGIAAGEVKGECDAEEFASLLLAILTGTGRAWVMAGQAFPLERTLRDRVSFLFDAVAAGSGLRGS